MRAWGWLKRVLRWTGLPRLVRLVRRPRRPRRPAWHVLWGPEPDPPPAAAWIDAARAGWVVGGAPRAVWTCRPDGLVELARFAPAAERTWPPPQPVSRDYRPAGRPPAPPEDNPPGVVLVARGARPPTWLTGWGHTVLSAAELVARLKALRRAPAVRPGGWTGSVRSWVWGELGPDEPLDPTSPSLPGDEHRVVTLAGADGRGRVVLEAVGRGVLAACPETGSARFAPAGARAVWPVAGGAEAAPDPVEPTPVAVALLGTARTGVDRRLSDLLGALRAHDRLGPVAEIRPAAGADPAAAVAEWVGRAVTEGPVAVVLVATADGWQLPPGSAWATAAGRWAWHLRCRAAAGRPVAVLADAGRAPRPAVADALAHLVLLGWQARAARGLLPAWDGAVGPARVAAAAAAVADLAAAAVARQSDTAGESP